MCVNYDKDKGLFKLIKWSTSNDEKRTPSKILYLNSENTGFQQANKANEEAKSLESKENCYDIFDFKIIRTPVSCKTYIIGGVQNKTIRLLTYYNTQAAIEPILVPYEVKVNMKYDLFSELSKALVIKTSKLSDSTESFKLFNQFFDYVQNKISCKKWVRECMANGSFMRNVFKEIENVLKEIESPSIGERLASSQFEIINCCLSVMNNFNRIAESFVCEVFSFDRFKAVSEKLKKEKELKEKIETEEANEGNNEEEIITSNEETAKEMQLQMIEDFLIQCFNRRHGDVISELRILKSKIGFSELETFYPKHNHSLVATKDFVFITGGDYKNFDCTFEILCVENDYLFKGPDMKNHRHSHCSFIINNYLYVALGSSIDEFCKSMSYERIEIPTAYNNKSLEEFYKEKKWEKGKIKSPHDSISYFKCLNSLNTHQYSIFCFGQFWKFNSFEKSARLTLKVNPKTKELSVEDIEDIEMPKEIDVLRDIEVAYEEQVHVPFFSDKGEWYIPIVKRNSNYIMKWDPTSLTYKNIE